MLFEWTSEPPGGFESASSASFRHPGWMEVLVNQTNDRVVLPVQGLALPQQFLL